MLNFVLRFQIHKNRAYLYHFLEYFSLFSTLNIFWTSFRGFSTLKFCGRLNLCFIYLLKKILERDILTRFRQARKTAYLWNYLEFFH